MEDKYEAVVFFDFDGVFTDNTVYVDENGKESIRCSKSDRGGLDLLDAFHINYMVLTCESNDSVKRRCEKLRIPMFIEKDKAQWIKKYLADNEDMYLLEQDQAALDEGWGPIYSVYAGNSWEDLELVDEVDDFIMVTNEDTDPRLLDMCEKLDPYVWIPEHQGGRGVVSSICRHVTKTVQGTSSTYNKRTD